MTASASIASVFPSSFLSARNSVILHGQASIFLQSEL
jgi:hypothetical protein